MRRTPRRPTTTLPNERDADAPEPDRWTQELPLPEPAPGLGADIVNDVTQIYLNEIGQHLLLSARGGALARPGDGRRRLRGAAAADRAQPAARRQHRQALHESRARASRPDRGRQPRADPRAQEVRRRARFPLHDVRDLVDPAGGRARDHEPVADDPASGARRQGAERRAARAAPSRDARRSRTAATRRSRTSRICSTSRSRRCARCWATTSARPRSTRRSIATRGVSIGDRLADEGALSPELVLHNARSKAWVRLWLDELNERQRTVIERRYGLNDRDVATLEELAREIGVTRERVRQIQAEALEKLRERLKRKGLDRDALL